MHFCKPGPRQAWPAPNRSWGSKRYQRQACPLAQETDMTAANYKTTHYHESLQGAKGAWRRASTLPGQGTQSQKKVSCPSTQQVPNAVQLHCVQLNCIGLRFNPKIQGRYHQAEEEGIPDKGIGLNKDTDTWKVQRLWRNIQKSPCSQSVGCVARRAGKGAWEGRATRRTWTVSQEMGGN